MRLLLIFTFFVALTCIAGYEVDPEIAQNIAEGEALLREVEQFLDDPSVPQSLKVREKVLNTIWANILSLDLNSIMLPELNE